MIGDPPPSVDLSGAGTEAEAAADLSAGEPGAAGPSSGP